MATQLPEGEVEVYLDINGVGWKILRGGKQLIATPVVTEVRRYDPEPADLGPVTARGGDAPGALEMKQMKQLIDAWAGQHKRELVLAVTAKPDAGGGLLLLLIALVAASE